RWWEAIPSTGYTLEELLKICNSVDGAIIVCTGDDKTWYRGGMTSSLRDNVVLEYGMLVAKLGVDRTLLLRGEARLPSDLAGMNCGKIVDDLATVAEVATGHMERVLRQRSIIPPQDGIPIVAHAQVSEACLSEPLPADWRQRTLYVRDGARR